MLLIFDCDGTLVDSELIALEVLSDMMGEFGVPMDVPACLDAFMGKHAEDIVGEIERLIGRALPPGEGVRMRERMLTRMRAELQPVPGAAAALAALDGPRCVASSSDPGRIALCLELTGLAPYFGDHLFSATQVAHGKPAPDLFLSRRRHHGVRARRLRRRRGLDRRRPGRGRRRHGGDRLCRGEPCRCRPRRRARSGRRRPRHRAHGGAARRDRPCPPEPASAGVLSA